MMINSSQRRKSIQIPITLTMTKMKRPPGDAKTSVRQKLGEAKGPVRAPAVALRRIVDARQLVASALARSSHASACSANANASSTMQ
mmetsp:Transcript_22231/g.41689  ORF Transcript_22231/g.41689 Transcript_22231/m.41689 type:complete len:87 (-) Transcript_22231:38-298(-)